MYGNKTMHEYIAGIKITDVMEIKNCLYHDKKLEVLASYCSSLMTDRSVST